jgi:hypothetical protein
MWETSDAAMVMYLRPHLQRTLWVLTPPAPVLRRATPNAQNSGAFDLGAIYASVVLKSVQRAYHASRQPRPRPSPPPLPLQPQVQSRTVPDPIISVDDADVEIVLEAPPARSARVLTWLGVGVTWLTTTALAFLVGASLSAHIYSPATTAATPNAEAAPPASVASSAMASARPDGPPVISVEDLPVAGSRPSPTVLRSAEPIAEPKTRAARTPAPIMAARAPGAPPLRAKAASAKVPSGPLTLEEAMRRAVYGTP